MIRIKTTNCLNSEDEVILEFEEEFTGNLLHGLNISIEKCNGKGELIANITLTYTEVLELYKMLTENICKTQIYTVDKLKEKIL